MLILHKGGPMKKHESKRIELFVADGFELKEIKRLQHILEHAVEEIAPETTIAVRRMSRNQGREEEGIEEDATQDEEIDDVFEEALRCVEGQLLRGRPYGPGWEIRGGDFPTRQFPDPNSPDRDVPMEKSKRDAVACAVAMPPRRCRGPWPSAKKSPARERQPRS